MPCHALPWLCHELAMPCHAEGKAWQGMAEAEARVVPRRGRGVVLPTPRENRVEADGDETLFKKNRRISKRLWQPSFQNLAKVLHKIQPPVESGMESRRRMTSKVMMASPKKICIKKSLPLILGNWQSSSSGRRVIYSMLPGRETFHNGCGTLFMFDPSHTPSGILTLGSPPLRRLRVVAHKGRSTSQPPASTNGGTRSVYEAIKTFSLDPSS